jgi:hypothetical protein
MVPASNWSDGTIPARKINDPGAGFFDNGVKPTGRVVGKLMYGCTAAFAFDTQSPADEVPADVAPPDVAPPESAPEALAFVLLLHAASATTPATLIRRIDVPNRPSPDNLAEGTMAPFLSSVDVSPDAMRREVRRDHTVNVGRWNSMRIPV